MSYGQYSWFTKRTWILYKDFSRALHVIPIQNPMSILNLLLLSTILTVGFWAAKALAFWVTAVPVMPRRTLGSSAVKVFSPQLDALWGLSK